MSPKSTRLTAINDNMNNYNSNNHNEINKKTYGYPSSTHITAAAPAAAAAVATSSTAAANIAAIRAISKLLSTCGIGAYFSRKGTLDKTAISVLSKLVYNVFQPCLLFVNVCSTVAKSGGDSAIFMLPLAASFQIMIGYIVGKIISTLVYGNKNKDEDGNAKPSLESKLLLTCTTFGNSGPLPFVFADALLKAHPDPTLAPKAVAYISLYLLGWSPLFWVIGTTILSEDKGNQSLKEKMSALSKRVLSPPVVASIMGLIIGNIPMIRNTFLPAKSLFNPVFEGMRTLGSAYLPAVLLVLAGSLVPPKDTSSTSTATTTTSTKSTGFFRSVSAVYLSRFLLMPTLGFTLIKFAKARIPLLAKVLSDPMLVFILLLETCMPSAQNSTVILSLNGDTAGAAKMARMLVAVYIAGIPAMSYWLAKIMGYTGLL